jgi:low temperature requirement protein LtrA
MSPVPATTTDRTDAQVPPLELFFDLVFVFAVSQLSEHLLTHLTWRGAAETLVLLVAVFEVWSYTSWGSTLPGLSRDRHRWTLVVVMVVALFMNAGITSAFEDGPWLFVVPYLVCRIGPAVYWRMTSSALREHYGAMLVWFVPTGALWVLGAVASSGTRLSWWALAATLEAAGSWLAHPIPRRHHFRTRDVAFSPGHMLERSRLFLIIGLGEAVLTTGVAVAGGRPSTAMILTAALAMVAIVALWALYFGGSDALVEDQAAATSDPLRAARLAVNTQVVVFASLIALAVANELAIDNPTGRTSATLGLLMFGGGVLYLAVQTWYLRALTGRTSRAWLVGLTALAFAGCLSMLGTPRRFGRGPVRHPAGGGAGHSHPIGTHRLSGRGAQIRPRMASRSATTSAGSCVSGMLSRSSTASKHASGSGARAAKSESRSAGAGPCSATSSNVFRFAALEDRLATSTWAICSRETTPSEGSLAHRVSPCSMTSRCWSGAL